MLLLAGCGGSKQENDARTASGEVLDGTISDAMLPIERTNSQPPLMRERASASDGTEGDEAAEEAGDAPLTAEQPSG